jgi:hypothetical protein
MKHAQLMISNVQGLLAVVIDSIHIIRGTPGRMLGKMKENHATELEQRRLKNML